MIFHENRLLADDSHVISYLIFVENWERWRKNINSMYIKSMVIRSTVNQLTNKSEQEQKLLDIVT